MPKFFNQELIPDYSQNISYDSEGRQQYIGIANPGTLDSEALWQIYILTYDGSGRMITRRYADLARFTIKWTLRTNATYS